MARETEKDYDHSYFKRGEKALIQDYGVPDYVTHNAERAFYHYLRADGKHKKPIVVLIDNYRNPQDDVMQEKGFNSRTSTWREAVEDICFQCECWVCPCELREVECVRDQEAEGESGAGDLEEINGWQGCRHCKYCVRGAMALVPLGETDSEIDGSEGDKDEEEWQRQLDNYYHRRIPIPGRFGP